MTGDVNQCKELQHGTQHEMTACQEVLSIDNETQIEKYLVKYFGCLEVFTFNKLARTKAVLSFNEKTFLVHQSATHDGFVNKFGC